MISDPIRDPIFDPIRDGIRDPWSVTRFGPIRFGPIQILSKLQTQGYFRSSGSFRSFLVLVTIGFSHAAILRKW